MAALESEQARQQLIHQTLSATTLPEIEAAWKALEAWIEARPEDEGMREGFEQLAQMREIVESEEAENKLLFAPIART